jgi:hypothetical protein
MTPRILDYAEHTIVIGAHLMVGDRVGVVTAITEPEADGEFDYDLGYNRGTTTPPLTVVRFENGTVEELECDAWDEEPDIGLLWTGADEAFVIAEPIDANTVVIPEHGDKPF